jgi:hypothetical protein
MARSIIGASLIAQRLDRIEKSRTAGRKKPKTTPTNAENAKVTKMIVGNGTPSALLASSGERKAECEPDEAAKPGKHHRLPSLRHQETA